MKELKAMPKADFVMIGGFLGAGKTTAILQLAHSLAQTGRRVGLITNDQSFGLVDTAMSSAQGFPVEEITGGCFCCRFNSLVEASDRLTEKAKPDVFVAEPVGSCTDLRAAVSYPLRRMYGDNFRIAPLSVLVDPVRAARVLRLEPGRVFSAKVLYIYRKQLEEAEIIVVNKSDLVGPERLARLRQALKEVNQRAEIFAVSAREGTGLDAWFGRLSSLELSSEPPPELDYETYAEGEALLGWMNSTMQVRGASPFDGNSLLFKLAAAVQHRLGEQAIEIAHLKMTLAPDEFGEDIGVLNLVRTDGEAELSHRLADELKSGQLILNLRAEGDPEKLRKAVDSARAEIIGHTRLIVAVEHEESFRPAKPSPTYRLVTA